MRDGGATAKTSSKRKGLQLFVSKMLLKNNDLYLFYEGTLRVMFTQLCTNVCFVFILFYSFVYFQYARTKQWLVSGSQNLKQNKALDTCRANKNEIFVIRSHWTSSIHGPVMPSCKNLNLLNGRLSCYLVCENVTWYRRKSQPKHPWECWYFIHFLQLSKCYNNQMKGFCFVFCT